MTGPPSTSAHVRSWLRGVAERLGSADPLPLIGPLIDQTFIRNADDPAYRRNALLPGDAPLELSFSERDGASLRLDLQPFDPEVAGRERLQAATRFAVDLAEQTFGQSAQSFANRLRDWKYHLGPRPPRFGAFIGFAFDGAGLTKITTYLELPDPGHPLPPEADSLAALGRSTIPGVRTLLGAVSVGQFGVSERLYLRCASGLRLMDLSDLAKQAGGAHRLPAFLDWALAATGGAFHLPPNAAVIGLRAEGNRVEVKLEVLAECLPTRHRLTLDALHAVLSERPGSAASFRRWCDAMSSNQRGFPGRISVVSVRIGVGDTTSVNVYVRPLAIQVSASARQ